MKKGNFSHPKNVGSAHVWEGRDFHDNFEIFQGNMMENYLGNVHGVHVFPDYFKFEIHNGEF